MSDYESHSGRLLPIKRLENEADFDYFTRVTGKEPDKDDLEESFVEALYGVGLEDDYFYAQNTLYRSLDHKRLDPYNTTCHIQGNDEDGYTYNTVFYNGGRSLSEMIEKGLQNLAATKTEK